MSKIFFPDRKRYEIEYGNDFMDIVNRLLDKNYKTRLGSGPTGWKEVLAHPFFKDFDVTGLMNHTMEPPFKPVKNVGVD